MAAQEASGRWPRCRFGLAGNFLYCFGAMMVTKTDATNADELEFQHSSLPKVFNQHALLHVNLDLHFKGWGDSDGDFSVLEGQYRWIVSLQEVSVDTSRRKESLFEMERVLENLSWSTPTHGDDELHGYTQFVFSIPLEGADYDHRHVESTAVSSTRTLVLAVWEQESSGKDFTRHDSDHVNRSLLARRLTHIPRTTHTYQRQKRQASKRSHDDVKSSYYTVLDISAISNPRANAQHRIKPKDSPRNERSVVSQPIVLLLLLFLVLDRLGVPILVQRILIRSIIPSSRNQISELPNQETHAGKRENEELSQTELSCVYGKESNASDDSNDEDCDTDTRLTDCTRTNHCHESEIVELSNAAIGTSAGLCEPSSSSMKISTLPGTSSEKYRDIRLQSKIRSQEAARGPNIDRAFFFEHPSGWALSSLRRRRSQSSGSNEEEALAPPPPMERHVVRPLPLQGITFEDEIERFNSLQLSSPSSHRTWSTIRSPASGGFRHVSSRPPRSSSRAQDTASPPLFNSAAEVARAEGMQSSTNPFCTSQPWIKLSQQTHSTQLFASRQAEVPRNIFAPTQGEVEPLPDDPCEEQHPRIIQQCPGGTDDMMRRTTSPLSCPPVEHDKTNSCLSNARQVLDTDGVSRRVPLATGCVSQGNVVEKRKVETNLVEGSSRGVLDRPERYATVVPSSGVSHMLLCVADPCRDNMAETCKLGPVACSPFVSPKEVMVSFDESKTTMGSIGHQEGSGCSNESAGPVSNDVESSMRESHKTEPEIVLAPAIEPRCLDFTRDEPSTVLGHGKQSKTDGNSVEDAAEKSSETERESLCGRVSANVDTENWSGNEARFIETGTPGVQSGHEAFVADVQSLEIKPTNDIERKAKTSIESNPNFSHDTPAVALRKDACCTEDSGHDTDSRDATRMTSSEEDPDVAASKQIDPLEQRPSNLVCAREPVAKHSKTIRSNPANGTGLSNPAGLKNVRKMTKQSSGLKRRREERQPASSCREVESRSMGIDKGSKVFAQAKMSAAKADWSVSQLHANSDVSRQGLFVLDTSATISTQGEDKASGSFTYVSTLSPDTCTTGSDEQLDQGGWGRTNDAKNIHEDMPDGARNSKIKESMALDGQLVVRKDHVSNGAEEKDIEQKVEDGANAPNSQHVPKPKQACPKVTNLLPDIVPSIQLQAFSADLEAPVWQYQKDRNKGGTSSRTRRKTSSVEAPKEVFVPKQEDGPTVSRPGKQIETCDITGDDSIDLSFGKSRSPKPKRSRPSGGKDHVTIVRPQKRLRSRKCGS